MVMRRSSIGRKNVAGSMKVSRIELVGLIKEVIGEVGDLKNIIPIELLRKKINVDGRSTALFSLPIEENDMPINGIIRITNITEYLDRVELPPVAAQDVVYNIGFEIGGEDTQYVKSDYKILLSTLKAVAQFVQEHMQELDTEVTYIIGATDKKFGAHIEDRQKSSLYRAIIGKNLPGGWRAGTGKLDGEEITYLSNKK